MSSKNAIVTGISNGIGKAIARMLLEEGYVVYGCGRTTLEADFAHHPQLHYTQVNLLDEKARQQWVSTLPIQIDVLIHNAGVAYYGMHETVAGSSIQEMSRINLEVPMVLTQQLLRPLRQSKGLIVFVSSHCACSPARQGAAYAATKAGLASFAESIFVENRKFGVRVSTIFPDLTLTQLYRHADFSPALESLSPEQVAQAVYEIVSLPPEICYKKVELVPIISKIQREKML